DTEMEEVD
nr:Chain A, yeast HSP90 C-terminus [Saccharomyces cerevisiae]5MGX_B Chain B, yeast HSP90 C-terminus [Saccharomyces cerevisiae]5MGX_C Chain C, yeast HSP90 C-terminus [Saccharomyces cerevisiae]5MGX_D Chain D, yeast HSP90 C-terminus [Saccharomyces cerevisiae]